MDITIWWIRRDLRLGNNPALKASLEQASRLIPLFVLDPALLNSPNTAPKRLAFLFDGLRQLDTELRTLGGRLILRQGKPVDVLSAVIRNSGARTIFAEADFSPYARRRDAEVAAQLPLVLIGGSTVSHPESVLKADGTPYIVFTPYLRAWRAVHHPTLASLIPKPKQISTPEDLASSPIPESPVDLAGYFPAGEGEALQRLHTFTGGTAAPIYQYSDSRNRMDLAGTSQLSPYLRFGMLSARQAIVAAQEAIENSTDSQTRKGAETWLNELIWREFYTAILYHFPSVLKESFRPDYRQITWHNDQVEFEAWCQGQTGYPIVDAAMRQLLHTGWMHNRARMIVASFLVKDLLIDWRWGERWFMQHLVDGDPAANNGGWQWTAGTGTDAAPYFRIFNPVLQGKKFDPQGDFTRQWVPELINVTARHIQTPWEMPESVQQQTGCEIGKDYPYPIIDHAFARQRTLEAFKMVKSSSKK
jgi:deoxyribodipyrimidine photo-lyase